MKSSSQDQSGKVFISYFNCYSFPSGSLGLQREGRLRPRNHHLKEGGTSVPVPSNLTERLPQPRSSPSESNFLPNLLLLDTDLLGSWREKILPVWVKMELIFLLQFPSPAYLGIRCMAGVENSGSLSMGCTEASSHIGGTGLPCVTSAAWSV